jgi:hypothetical protein
VPIAVHGPSATLRSMVTTWLDRSGSTTARTSTLRTRLPSVGASIVTSGCGTAADRVALTRSWPRLSSTTAL